MKTFKRILTATFAFLLIFSSCQEEEIIQGGDTTNENAITANSRAAQLMQRTASNDGSNDNIIDNANCVTVSLPVTVIVNGLEITVNSEEDLDLIEDIFDEIEDDEDILEIIFPITVVLSDFSAITIANIDQFEDLIEDCNGENEEDDDIECIDFVYPLNVEVFNSLTEATNEITITNDEQLYNLIDDLDDNEVASLIFPVSLVLSDGSVVQANSLDLLENLIDNAQDDCDEDDDYDFNDDDCQNCTTNQLADILTDCSDWFIDKFEVNDTDLEDNFDGFTFNFERDGTITMNDGSSIQSGTWSAQGEGQNIVVTISIPDFNEFNAAWMLHEIEEESNEKKVDLRLPNKDRLRFESECN